jgi:hypothetical protein
VGGHGFGSDEAIWAGQWFIYLSLFIAGPLRLLQIVKSGPEPRVSGSEKSCWAGLLLSMAGTLVFASKSGARPVQWLPFVPMLLYAAAAMIKHTNVQDVVEVFCRRPWLQAAGLAFLLTALTSAGVQEAQIISAIRQQNPYTRAIYADLGGIMKAMPAKKICMGCGVSESEFISTHFLPLVFANQPYVLDPVAVMDANADNLPLSNKTREIMANKVVDVWLIPRDDSPFAMLNPFAPHRPLFDDGFRQAFAANYVVGGSSQFFDVYVHR